MVESCYKVCENLKLFHVAVGANAIAIPSIAIVATTFKTIVYT